MRSCASLGLLLVAAGLGASCDTDQPLQTTSGNMSVDFTGVNGEVRKYDVYEIFENSDGDTAPDDIDGDGVADVTLFCQTADTGLVESAPWPFSATIKLIPAGQLEPIVLVTSGDQADNLTRYDTAVQNVLNPSPGVIEVTHERGRCVTVDVTCNPDLGPAFCLSFDPSSQNVCERQGVCSANPGIACVVPERQTDPDSCSAQGRCSRDPSVFCNPANAAQCQNQGLGSCVTFGTCVGDTVTRRFEFSASGQRLSGANRTVMSAKPNLLAASCCTTWNQVGVPPTTGPVTCTGQTVCSGLASNWEPGICPPATGSEADPANLGDQPLPYTVDLKRGDTLIVEARRSADGPDIDFTNSQNLPVLRAAPRFNGVLLTSGQFVGNIDAGATDPVLSFYFIAD